jgi:hypothetical protein
MKNITYLDDGNEELVKKGFVDKLNPTNNEQPLYIINYDDRYGNKKYVSDPEVTINQVADINLERAQNMNIEALNLITSGDNMVEIQNADNSIDDAKMIALIIKMLNQGKRVIYNPVSKPGYDALYYETLKTKLDIYKLLDFVFVPEVKTYDFGDFFKPAVKTNMPMLFCPGNDILIKFLSMFLSLVDLSEYINNGSYEIISRLRVGYMFPSKKNNNNITNDTPASVEPIIGGGAENLIADYENGLEDMYGNKMTGGIKMKHKKTYRRKKHNKNKTIRRKYRK